MDKHSLIQLTNSLYRLTLFFPKKEPLRSKMREKASDILANSLLISNPSKKTEVGPLQGLNDLEILDSFFEVAKSQKWVSLADILAVQEEYAKLREQLKIGSVGGASSDTGRVVTESRSASQIGNRQEKILEFLKEQGKAQVWQIQQIFPGLTKRTLRRDFEQMLNQGIIERMGEKNNTFYRCKVWQSLIPPDIPPARG